MSPDTESNWQIYPRNATSEQQILRRRKRKEMQHIEIAEEEVFQMEQQNGMKN